MVEANNRATAPRSDGTDTDPLAPSLTQERAAGLLAGRAGCQVGEAHALLREVAGEQHRPVRDVAAEALTVLEHRVDAGALRARAVLERTAHRHRPPGGGTATDLPADDWTGTVQQLLDAMPGNHALLVPLRDADDEIDDYQIAGASPAATDVSGRRGAQVIGLRIRAAYPAAVEGPLWETSQKVLGDGVARVVGPFPYSGTAEGVQVQLMLTVWIRRVGAGLLYSWIRHGDRDRLSEQIAETERLAKLGWREHDLVNNATSWSDQLYRIYDRDPAAGPLTREESDALTIPEDQPIPRQAAESLAQGQPVDITYRIRVNGQLKHVRTVTDALQNTDGDLLRVFGVVQDVTARESSRTHLAEIRQQLREHQQSLAWENRLAAQLQQVILPVPDRPIDLPGGLQVAVRYLPAEEAGRVGGDWYHTESADDGSVIIAVGDVAGHGIRSATTMAQLRHALGALAATTTTDPGELLSHLNRLLHSDDITSIASAVVARFDPETSTLRWAQAGHPAPLLTRNGTTIELERPAGPILGALRDATYATTSTRLTPDDLLMLYTDGLVERREQPQGGLGSVIETLNRLSSENLQQPLVDLLSHLDRANPNDDTCVVAAQPRTDTETT